MKKLFVYGVGLALILVIGGRAEFRAKGEELPSGGEFQSETLSPSSRIDEILARTWIEKGIQPSAPVSDGVFLRRIYLDIAGRIPTKEEAARFLDDRDPAKRAALIDALLDSEGYVNHFYHFWADILRLHSNINGGNAVFPMYAAYVKDALRNNKPYDEFVRELVTAKGTPSESGAVGYYARDRGMPLDNLANTIRIFLGTRLECAQCHNHPFDKWTQMDFYHMAAFSFGMRASNNGNGVFNDVRQLIQKSDEWSKDEKRDLNRAVQEIGRPLRRGNSVQMTERLPQLPHDYQYPDAEPKETVEPAAMFGVTPAIPDAAHRVDAYADWMTSPGNERFTVVIANRLWKKAMGKGLIEPVDEIMEDTAASIPELMRFLEQQMIALDYDMKAFLRMIFNTRAYQRKATTAEVVQGEAYYFPGPLLRRMSAEQIWDSVVAMVNTTPDRPDWKRLQQQEIQAASSRLYTDALGGLSPDSLMTSAEKIARMQASLRKRLEELQKESNEARKNKDKERLQKISRESNDIRNRLRKDIQKLVYAPAMKGRDEQMIPVSYPSESGTIELPLSMVSDEGRPSDAFRRKQQELEKQLIAEEMDALGFDDPKKEKEYTGFRAGAANRFLRAANLSSPAPRGHFLREFGQSDRETIENASEEASVPQALELLNGGTFASLVNRNSVLSRGIASAETPREKIDAIYLSMLTRPATEEEMELLLEEFEKRGEDLHSDVIFALLNGQEFLFVQ